MLIDEKWKRRVRIANKSYDKMVGYNVYVTDLETGQTITNITEVVIRLKASEYNVAEITYYEANKDEDAKTITLTDCEVEVSAYEVSRD